jgi:hypothetical protein
VKKGRLMDRKQKKKLEALKKDIKELCDETGFDFEQIEDPKPKIIPLIKNLKTIQSWENLLNSIDSAHEKIHDLRELINLTSSGTDKQKSLLNLFAYLVYGEGVFSELVQIIAFILMENDHDIYDPRRMEFVNTYEHLYKLDLYVKMQFIEKHGFGMLTKSFDRDLRNCIAHLDFVIHDNGKIISKKTQETISSPVEGIMNPLNRKVVSSFVHYLRVLYAILSSVAEEGVTIKKQSKSRTNAKAL